MRSCFRPIGMKYIIRLANGSIEGTSRTSIYGNSYFSFEGIPYAKPPIGALRFLAPELPKNWSEVRNCKQPGNKPMQQNPQTGIVEGSEDCLYLNVYTKFFYSTQLLPVMVFIYGGSFLMGGATEELYSPDYFMMKDVIVVTFNYRLCSLGFLSLNDPSLNVPGNAGLRDQVMALTWVKENIIHFNGDPNNITLFGMSAGAACVHYMMAIEEANGLFSKAILMSGTMLNYWACMSQKDFAYRLAKHNGYDGKDSPEHIFTFLKSLPAEALVDHFLLTPDEVQDGYMFAFGPVREPYFKNHMTVIPNKPLQMQRSSWGNCIPLMLGAASFEGLVAYPWLKIYPNLVDSHREQPQLILPADVKSSLSNKTSLKCADLLYKQHFANGSSPEMSFMDMVSYKAFWLGIHRTVMSRVLSDSAATYLYRFDFDSPDFNQERKKLCGTEIIHGVAHADELSYLFFRNTAWKLDANSKEFLTIERMIGIWTAFAENSSPQCPELGSIAWKPVESDFLFRACNIGKTLEMMDLPEKDKLKIWEECYQPEDLY